MKQYLRKIKLTYFVAAGMLLMASCAKSGTKEEINNPTTPTIPNQVELGQLKGQFGSKGLICPVSASAANGLILVTAATPTGEHIAFWINGTGKGTYTIGDASVAGNVDIRTNVVSKKEEEYGIIYYEPMCPPPPQAGELTYAQGTVTIDVFNNTTIEGTFDATLYHESGHCYDPGDPRKRDKQKVTGSFKAKRV